MTPVTSIQRWPEPEDGVPSPPHGGPTNSPVVSIVYPCLNEEKAIGACVRAARQALVDAGLSGEVLVVDNASTDRTAEIAHAFGARVVHEQSRGYGAACRRGLLEAEGDYVILLDADGTYPVQMTGEFVRLMREEAADMVMGNRFAGLMDHDAMPLLNRYVGNPVLSGMTRMLFGARLKDIHCGMRAVRRDRIALLDLQTPGMEFATEMVVKALDQDLAIREVAIPYRPRLGLSKLNPLRDAWRHVEYMLTLSPALFLVLPGTFLFAAGLAVQLFLLSGPRTVLARTWDVHTNVAGLAAALVGSALVVLGIVMANYAWTGGMKFQHSQVARAIAAAGDRLPRYLGLSLTLVGALMWAALVARWAMSGFGALAAVPYLALASTALAAGFEMVSGAFLVNIMRLRRGLLAPPLRPAEPARSGSLAGSTPAA